MELKSSDTSFSSIDEMFPYPAWKKSTSDVLDDLLLVIQGIVSGTVSVSNNILSGFCLECKLQMATTSPVVILQYALESHRYSGLSPHETKGNSEQVCSIGSGIKENSEHEIMSENFKDNLVSAFNVKQEVPEVIDVLNNSKEHLISVDSVQDIHLTKIMPEINIANSETNTELVVVTPDLDMISFETNRRRKNCESALLNELSERTINTSKKLKTYSRKCKTFEKQSYDYANESLQTKQNNQKLERTHSEEEPFSCKDCGKSFTNSDDLLKHRRIHTGELPFKCEDCGKSFIQSSQLVTHQRMHRDKQTSFIQSDYLLQNQKVHKNERSYPCELCGKSFVQAFLLINHQRKHTGERPYSCTTCGRSFMQPGHLTIHKRTHSDEKSFSIQRLW